MARTRTVVVAGAGIGGLAAAVGLARAGFRSLVLERAPALEEAGAGIQLSPNATRALAALGALDAVRKRAVTARALLIGDGKSGRELARLPLGSADAPYLLTLRADLQGALLAAAADLVDIEIELGAEVTDAAAHARGVTVLCQRGGRVSEELGQVLIGADGLWSRLRARLHGAAPPRFHGLVAWRALVPASAVPEIYRAPDVRLWLGPRAHVVHYPVAGRTQINLVAIFADDWQGEGWSEAAGALPVPAARWAEMPGRLLAAAKNYRRWALADRPPLPRWSGDRMTLLGDAAHPMLPFLAQGAAAALEDAVVLSARLADRDDIATALHAYEAERAPRAARLQAAARATGAIYHWRGPLGFARNVALRLLGPRLAARQNWIYRYEPV